MLQELVSYVASQTGHTIGTNLFAATWDVDAPSVCSLIRETAGVPNALLIGTGVRGVQILSRGPDWMSAETELNRIFDVLYNRGAIALPAISSGGDSFLINQVVPRSYPYYVGQDENAIVIYTTTLSLYMQAT